MIASFLHYWHEGTNMKMSITNDIVPCQYNWIPKGNDDRIVQHIDYKLNSALHEEAWQSTWYQIELKLCSKNLKVLKEIREEKFKTQS